MENINQLDCKPQYFNGLSYRRHTLKTNFQKRLKYYDYQSDKPREWVMILKKTAKLCSCFLCKRRRYDRINYPKVKDYNFHQFKELEIYIKPNYRE